MFLYIFLHFLCFFLQNMLKCACVYTYTYTCTFVYHKCLLIFPCFLCKRKHTRSQVPTGHVSSASCFCFLKIHSGNYVVSVHGGIFFLSYGCIVRGCVAVHMWIISSMCCFVFVQIHYFSVGYGLNCISSQTLMLKSWSPVWIYLETGPLRR